MRPLSFPSRLVAAALSLGLFGELRAQTCTPPRPDLISSWGPESLLGTTVSDSKAQNPGSVKGGVTAVSDPRLPGPRKFERVFRFDGAGFIDIGNPVSLQLGTKPFSLEAWFVSDQGGSSIRNVIRKSNYPTSSPGAGYWIRLTENAQKIEFMVGETVGIASLPRAALTAAVNPGVWHHVVGTRTPSEKIELYLDGRLMAHERLVSTFSVDAPTRFTIGAWNERFGPTEFFSGHMTDVSVYSRALTPNEIHALFNAATCKFWAR